MDSKVKLYLERSENELRLARAIFNLSESEKSKLDLGVNLDDTFYSAVISHSYYCIFYCSKSFLISRGVKVKFPNEHKKTYEEFKKFVDSGVIDRGLNLIYEDLLFSASELLRLFLEEKKKRGKFVYRTLAQANKLPAKESIENAVKFLSSVKLILENE